VNGPEPFHELVVEPEGGDFSCRAHCSTIVLRRHTPVNFGGCVHRQGRAHRPMEPGFLKVTEMSFRLHECRAAKSGRTRVRPSLGSGTKNGPLHTALSGMPLALAEAALGYP
jgi:hypothetical protein